MVLFADDLVIAETEEALYNTICKSWMISWMNGDWRQTGRRQESWGLERSKRYAYVMSELMGREWNKWRRWSTVLGAMISSDGSMDREVEQRIGMASKMIGAIRSTVLGRKELTKRYKIESAECYGHTHLDLRMWSLGFAGTVWGTNTGYTDEGVKMEVLRLNRIRNVDLRGRLRQEEVLDLVKRWQQTLK